MQSPGLGGALKVEQFISKTDERLCTPAAGPSVFRTGSRRHSEPLVFARAELKAVFFESQGLIPTCISQG